MQTFDYFVVGLAVIALVVSVWRRGGLSTWDQAELRHLVAALVLEAEQTMPGDSGKEKLSWVLRQADELGLTKFIPGPVLSALIESTVYCIRQWQPQPAVLPLLAGPDDQIAAHQVDDLARLLDQGVAS